MTKQSHYLFILSIISAIVQDMEFMSDNAEIRNCFLIDRLCVYALVFQFVLVSCIRIPLVIMSHIPILVPLLHSIKIYEAKLHRLLCKRKVKIIKVDKQPYIEDGWIRCGDPNCKTMHKANKNKQN